MALEGKREDGVTGWRGKIGWICPAIPSSIQLLDFHSVVPDGVELKIVTLGITAHTDDQFERALAQLEEAADRVAFTGAQFISVEGTPLVSTGGFGSDKEIISRLEKTVGVPVTTSLTATVEALRTLNLKKLVMASPMNRQSDERAKRFLEASGVEIIHLKSLNITLNRDIHALPRSAAYTLAKQAFLEAPQAEGIYIPCGAWCPPWVIDCLETDFGVPAIHSRQVSTWAALKALQIREPVKGWGKIFRTLYE
jgi:maleate isomerase